MTSAAPSELDIGRDLFFVVFEALPVAVSHNHLGGVCTHGHDAS